MRLGKLQRQFAQMHAASLISSVDTTDVRGHVAKHDIDQLIANQRFQLQQHRVLAEVTDDDLDTGNGIKRQNVERQQLSLGTQQRPRKLTPATGRGTEVDDDLPRTKDQIGRASGRERVCQYV